jgi:hypothetical protein
MEFPRKIAKYILIVLITCMALQVAFSLTIMMMEIDNADIRSFTAGKYITRSLTDVSNLATMDTNLVQNADLGTLALQYIKNDDTLSSYSGNSGAHGNTATVYPLNSTVKQISLTISPDYINDTVLVDLVTVVALSQMTNLTDITLENKKTLKLKVGAKTSTDTTGIQPNTGQSNDITTPNVQPQPQPQLQQHTGYQPRPL